MSSTILKIIIFQIKLDTEETDLICFPKSSSVLINGDAPRQNSFSDIFFYKGDSVWAYGDVFMEFLKANMSVFDLVYSDI